MKRNSISLIVLIFVNISFSKILAQELPLTIIIDNKYVIDETVQLNRKDDLSTKNKERISGIVSNYKIKDHIGDSVKILINPALSLAQYKIVNNPVGRIRLGRIKDYMEKSLAVRMNGLEVCGKTSLLSCEFKGVIEK